MREKLISGAFRGEKTPRVPFWFMRQAGRYLPEYRALREKAGGFLEMVYDPEIATEVTLQPVRRFGMDAAILFSDILVVPQALGVGLEFSAGEGPKLAALSDDLSDIPDFDAHAFEAALSPVYETVRRVRSGLEREGFSECALIGFAGAPWTIACYMVEGGGSRDFQRAKFLALSNPQKFQILIDRIVEATVCYLRGQILAGAEAVQLFDSWAGVLDGQSFARWAIDPVRRIVEAVRREFPLVPVIGFPRGAGGMYPDFARASGVDVVGIDSGVGLDFAVRNIQGVKTVQGNLDPVALLAGGMAMERAAHDILEALSKGPFVFNLGHGIIKETPPENVARLCEIVREWKP